MPDGVNDVTGDVVDAAVLVRGELGAGLLEKTYSVCLAHELARRGRVVETEVVMPLVFRGQRLDAGYRMDMRVDGLVIVEVKAADALHPAHVAQILTYLRLSGCPVGLLLNFNAVPFRSGIRRVVSPLNRPAAPDRSPPDPAPPP